MNAGDGMAPRPAGETAGPAEGTGGAAALEHGGLDPRLVEVLRCPASGGPLELDAQRGELIARTAGLAYP
ncbi:MAG: Trm112 family protein, partial [Sphingomonadaceae bacterium]